MQAVFFPIGVTPSSLALSIPSCVSQPLLYSYPLQVIVHADLSTFQLHFHPGIVSTRDAFYLPFSFCDQAFSRHPRSVFQLAPLLQVVPSRLRELTAGGEGREPGSRRRPGEP